MTLGFKFSKNFAFELNFLHFIRRFSDGLSLLEFKIEGDWYKGDHNPQFGFQIIAINTMLIELRIYNINHIEDDERTKELIVPCPNCKQPLPIRIQA